MKERLSAVTVSGLALFLLVAFGVCGAARAEIRKDFHALKTQDGATVVSVYYYQAGQQPTTAFLIMHPRNVTVLNHFALEPLANRGFGALGLAPRNVGSSGIHEEMLIDIAAGIKFLRSQGVKNVILLGHSGGGGTSGYYESQAETPIGKRVKETPAGDPPDLNKFDLPKADGLILSSAQEGEGIHIGHRMDPSVVDETDPFSYDPSLDMYNPDNGWKMPPEQSHYSPEFLARVQEAQRQRNQRLVQIAKGYLREQKYYEELLKSPAYQQMSLQEKLMVERRARFERPITVYRTYADVNYYDLSLDPSDRLLGHYSGPTVNGQFRSDLNNWASEDRMWCISPQAYLSTESIATNARLWDNGHSITVPTLVINGSADSGILPGEAQKTFDSLGSKDKEKVMVIGASHYFDPMGPQAGKRDQREQYFRAITEWAHKHWK